MLIKLRLLNFQTSINNNSYSGEVKKQSNGLFGSSWNPYELVLNESALIGRRLSKKKYNWSCILSKSTKIVSNRHNWTLSIDKDLFQFQTEQDLVIWYNVLQRTIMYHTIKEKHLMSTASKCNIQPRHASKDILELIFKYVSVHMY